MKENLLKDKSYLFALQIIKVYKSLKDEQKEFVLSKQLLRSGSSIGANVEEAIGAQTKRDFLNKISIAYKESRETQYWIRLLKDSEYLSEQTANRLINDNDELIKIMGAIIATTKANLQKEKLSK